MIEWLTSDAFRGGLVLGLLIGAAAVTLIGQWRDDVFRGAK